MAGGKAQATALKKRATNEIEERGFRTSGHVKFSGPIFGKTLSRQGLPNINGGSDLSQCDQIITPPCIKAMYNITPPTKAAPGNQLGIFEEGDFYAAEDLVEFFVS
jgi:tripeptidyl-peptidase-1